MKKIIYAVVIIFIISSTFFLINNKQRKELKINNKNIETNNNQEKYTFIENGTTKNTTELYEYKDNKFIQIGRIEKNIKLNFIKLVDNYLLIDSFNKEYYVKINDVEISENHKNIIDERYKNYIPFNENIITENETKFYDKEDNLLYSIKNSYDLPIIIKENDKYGVEYNNQLLFIKKDNIKEIKQNNNTDKKNTSGVGVLNYHFFYDENNQKEKNECNQIICISKSNFKKHLDYFKENNILTITTNELELYMDGKINLPKSILITIDDGYMMNAGIELLEENKMYATVFLITSWFENVYFKNNFKYIEFHSHGEKLHDTGVCPGGQGGAIKCLSREKLLDDLKISREKLDNTTSFAYPFYEYNNYSISILKEAGITMAFAGEETYDNLAHVGGNKYKIPRFVVVSNTTANNIANYLSKIN